jgi:hypothetical protein
MHESNAGNSIMYLQYLKRIGEKQTFFVQCHFYLRSTV